MSHSPSLIQTTAFPLNLKAPFGNPEYMRPDFGSPEAVQGFLLQAYRPWSHTNEHEFKGAEQEENCKKAKSSVLTFELKASCQIQPEGLHRTDIPLGSFIDTTSVNKCLSISLPADQSCIATCELRERSDSAPACISTLKVADLWADVPASLTANPFDQVTDFDGLFSRIDWRGD